MTTSLGPKEVYRRREMVPRTRIVTVEEVANGALFFRSDMISYLTGEEIVVTVGIRVRREVLQCD